jgi:hypothetical protein
MTDLTKIKKELQEAFEEVFADELEEEDEIQELNFEDNNG